MEGRCEMHVITIFSRSHRKMPWGSSLDVRDKRRQHTATVIDSRTVVVEAQSDYPPPLAAILWRAYKTAITSPFRTDERSCVTQRSSLFSVRATKLRESQLVSEATQKSYNVDFTKFERWLAADDRSLDDLREADIARYVTCLNLQGLRHSTIKRHVAAIRQHLHARGCRQIAAGRLVDEAFCNAQNRDSVKDQVQSQMSERAESHLVAMLSVLPHGLMGTRDRAILLLMVTTGMNARDIVALPANGIIFTQDSRKLACGVSWRSDPDEDMNRVLFPPAQSVITSVPEALQEWLHASQLVDGALFRAINLAGQISDDPLSPYGVNYIVRRAATNAGVDYDAWLRKRSSSPKR